MEFLVVGLIIFLFVGLSSNRTKKSSTYSRNMYVTPPNVANGLSQKQSAETLSPANWLSPAIKPVPAEVSSVVRTHEGYLPDDRCNKCGKSWNKFENIHNGGRFFACSGWPKCDNSREKQIREKFCSNGHRRTSSNTAYTASGQRRCLICRPFPEEVIASSRTPQRSPEKFTSPTINRRKEIDLDKYCRNGHPRTSENTYVRPNGERECRVCRSNARR